MPMPLGAQVLQAAAALLRLEVCGGGLESLLQELVLVVSFNFLVRPWKWAPVAPVVVSSVGTCGHLHAHLSRMSDSS
jgi:hypothetical protein